MKPSVWSDYFRWIPPEDGMQAFREAGFSATELSTGSSRELRARGRDYEKTGHQFRAFLDSIGFSIPQGHLAIQSELATREGTEELKREIDMFQAIGIKNAVIHINGGKELSEEARMELQLKHMRELLEQVKGTDFTFCLENLRSNPAVADVDKILHWIDLLGDKNLGICLDTGHLHTTNVTMKTSNQTQEEFILKAGSRLKALHINNNDGTDDYHLTPFTIKNSIDWAEVMTALRKIGYSGLFNLELPGEIACKPPMYILKRKLLYMKDVIDYMLSDSFPEQ